jgi:hypothetical protein
MAEVILEVADVVSELAAMAESVAPPIKQAVEAAKSLWGNVKGVFSGTRFRSRGPPGGPPVAEATRLSRPSALSLGTRDVLRRRSRLRGSKMGRVRGSGQGRNVQTITVTARDYLGDIDGTEVTDTALGRVLLSMDLAPQSLLGTRLEILSKIFETYFPVKIAVVYEPAIGSQTAGQLLFVTDPDPSRRPEQDTVVDYREWCAQQGAIVKKVWEEARTQLSIAPGQNQRYTDAADPEEAPQLSSPGCFVCIAGPGFPAAATGAVYLESTYTFSVAKSHIDGVGALLAGDTDDPDDFFKDVLAVAGDWAQTIQAGGASPSVSFRGVPVGALVQYHGTVSGTGMTFSGMSSGQMTEIYEYSTTNSDGSLITFSSIWRITSLDDQDSASLGWSLSAGTISTAALTVCWMVGPENSSETSTTLAARAILKQAIKSAWLKKRAALAMPCVQSSESKEALPVLSECKTVSRGSLSHALPVNPDEYELVEVPRRRREDLNSRPALSQQQSAPPSEAVAAGAVTPRPQVAMVYR